MENLTGRCALCGKEFSFKDLSLLDVADQMSRKMAIAALSGESFTFPTELKCCKDRGLSSTSVFCKDCKKLLGKEEQLNTKA